MATMLDLNAHGHVQLFCVIRTTLDLYQFELATMKSSLQQLTQTGAVRLAICMRISLRQVTWFRPLVEWLSRYRSQWLMPDAVAGFTLAAYAIPVSLAYAGLAGLPPQVGVYGYLLGGTGYALLGSSRQLAVGPTSANSLMKASSVGALAGGDPVRYGEIASLIACILAILCIVAWLIKLSLLMSLVSDSVHVGFKAGAGLTIMRTQLPSLLGVAGGGHSCFDRAIMIIGQLPDGQLLVLATGVIALLLLLVGERFWPTKPIGLGVVALSIVVASSTALPELGVPVTGLIPQGLPSLSLQSYGLVESSELFPIAAGCWSIRPSITSSTA